MGNTAQYPARVSGQQTFSIEELQRSSHTDKLWLGFTDRLHNDLITDELYQQLRKLDSHGQLDSKSNLLFSMLYYGDTKRPLAQEQQSNTKRFTIGRSPSFSVSSSSSPPPTSSRRVSASISWSPFVDRDSELWAREDEEEVFLQVLLEVNPAHIFSATIKKLATRLFKVCCPFPLSSLL